MAARLLPRAAFLQLLHQSSYTLPVQPEYLTSETFQLVNPRGHVTNTDCVAQTLPAPALAGRSDEAVLALLTSGFFGGFVFGFERFVLRMGGCNILPARYTGFTPPPDAVDVWANAELPEDHLLPVGSCIFGGFRMLAKHVAAMPFAGACAGTPSYVDYAFGSDEFMFAGCHRFQITRRPARASDGPEGPAVLIELQHFRCNPQTNRPSPAEPLERFHFVYAKALFANAVQALLSGAQA